MQFIIFLYYKQARLWLRSERIGKILRCSEFCFHRKISVLRSSSKAVYIVKMLFLVISQWVSTLLSSQQSHVFITRSPHQNRPFLRCLLLWHNTPWYLLPLTIPSTNMTNKTNFLEAWSVIAAQPHGCFSPWVSQIFPIPVHFFLRHWEERTFMIHSCRVFVTEYLSWCQDKTVTSCIQAELSTQSPNTHAATLGCS